MYIYFFFQIANLFFYWEIGTCMCNINNKNKYFELLSDYKNINSYVFNFMLINLSIINLYFNILVSSMLYLNNKYNIISTLYLFNNYIYILYSNT